MRRLGVLTIVIFALSIAGCRRSDEDEAHRKLREAGQEVRKDLRDARDEAKKGLKEANREAEKALNDARREVRDAARDARDAAHKDKDKPNDSDNH
jgi:vacuolar-type H+-ATPase subunit H